jgi:hypothetical protein
MQKRFSLRRKVNAERESLRIPANLSYGIDAASRTRRNPHEWRAKSLM